MPLIQDRSKASIDKNIGTEINAGKPRDQASAIAYSIARKMQHKARGGMMKGMNRSYANGGLIQRVLKKHSTGHPDVSEQSILPDNELSDYDEHENFELSDDHHFGNESHSEPEDKEHLMDWDKFSNSELADDDDKYDVAPGKYSAGGPVHPLAKIFRNGLMKKMAYGGHIEKSELDKGEEYPEWYEENYDLDHDFHDDPMDHTADDDESGKRSFARAYMTHQAMRKR